MNSHKMNHQVPILSNKLIVSDSRVRRFPAVARRRILTPKEVSEWTYRIIFQRGQGGKDLQKKFLSESIAIIA